MVRQSETAHFSLFWTTISGITSYLISCTMFFKVSCGQCNNLQNPLRKVGRYGGATTLASKNFWMMRSWSDCHWLGSSGATLRWRDWNELSGLMDTLHCRFSTLKAITLGSLVSMLVRYSSLLIICCSCRLMKTQPRNLCKGDTRPQLLEPGRGLGRHNSSNALAVRGVGMAAAQSLWGKIREGV